MTKFFAHGAVLAVLLSASGCQVHRMPGGRLPGLAAMREEQAIAAHAAKSNFPSPSDVGLDSGGDADE